MFLVVDCVSLDSRLISWYLAIGTCTASAEQPVDVTCPVSLQIMELTDLVGVVDGADVRLLVVLVAVVGVGLVAVTAADEYVPRLHVHVHQLVRVDVTASIHT